MKIKNFYQVSRGRGSASDQNEYSDEVGAQVFAMAILEQMYKFRVHYAVLTALFNMKKVNHLNEYIYNLHRELGSSVKSTNEDLLKDEFIEFKK